MEKVDIDSALRGLAVIAGGLAIVWIFKFVVKDGKYDIQSEEGC